MSRDRTAQGFALSEANLYTVEAFRDYLDHLERGGVLAVTRVHRLVGDEALRATVLALEALERDGVAEPEQGVAVLLGRDIFGELFGTAARPRAEPASVLRGLVFFAAIGVGFLLLEIVLIQRFTLFLGFPTYALPVVLFSLLVFTGLGSPASACAREPRRPRSCSAPPCRSASPARAACTRAPWAWAINGVSSVLASVLAVAVAITWGFRAVTLLALACYLVALAHAARGRWPGQPSR